MAIPSPQDLLQLLQGDHDDQELIATEVGIIVVVVGNVVGVADFVVLVLVVVDESSF